MAYLDVLSPGFFSSVQDNGRVGMKSIGISSGGVLDIESYSLSNLILGNSKNDACVEIIGGGFEVVFSESTFFCITGAVGKNYLNESSILLNAPYYASSGSKLNISIFDSGWIGYLNILGGVKTKKILGSRSVYINSEIFGKKIEKFEKINYQVQNYFPQPKIYKIKKKYSNLSSNQDIIPIRVLESAQFNNFSEVYKQVFFNSTFTISQQYNRQGMRLLGPSIEAKKNNHDVISDYVNKGSIQIPGDKLPIILLSDSQTTGGYPKIANVISVDFSKLVQLRPGSKIKFVLVTIDDAQKAYKKNIKYMQQSMEEETLNTFTCKVNGSNIDLKYHFDGNISLIGIDGRLMPLDFIK
ncbi:MAG: biotin-dependent carboxyltransferase family protein [Dehalococcoidia bacterium]